MSELAHRRFMRAEKMSDVDPKDALEAVLWEIRNPEPDDEPVDHVFVIRASLTEDGLAYKISQAGKFNIAERMGVINLIAARITAPDIY
jgi:hypothetical protein